MKTERPTIVSTIISSLLLVCFTSVFDIPGAHAEREVAPLESDVQISESDSTLARIKIKQFLGVGVGYAPTVALASASPSPYASPYPTGSPTPVASPAASPVASVSPTPRSEEVFEVTFIAENVNDLKSMMGIPASIPMAWLQRLILSEKSVPASYTFKSGAPKTHIVRTSREDLLHELADLGLITYQRPIVGKTFVTPNDQLLIYQPSLHNDGTVSGYLADIDINAPEMWNTISDTGEIVVAVIDTGIDLNHPDLRDNLWSNPVEIPGNGIDEDDNAYIDDVHGMSALSTTPDAQRGSPADVQYHGTVVSGIIAARGNNGIGTVGVAWRSKIMALGAMNASGSGNLADAIRALEYAIEMKKRWIDDDSTNGGANVRVVNMSIGFSGSCSAAGLQYVRDAISEANKYGILIVAASGNEGINIDFNPIIPATCNYSNIISVGAVDGQGNRPSYSNYGASNVDFFAPGAAVVSTVPSNFTNPFRVDSSGGKYAAFNGTSVASPHVTGMAALMLAHNPYLSPYHVGFLLRNSTRTRLSLAGLAVSPGVISGEASISNSTIIENSWHNPNDPYDTFADGLSQDGISLIVIWQEIYPSMNPRPVYNTTSAPPYNDIDNNKFIDMNDFNLMRSKLVSIGRLYNLNFDATVGQTFTLTRDPLSAPYIIPANATFNRSTGVLTWVPTAEQVGENILEIIAYDGVHRITVNVISASSAPVIITQPTSQTVNAGQMASFSCAASGSPSPTYQWQKNSVNISGATSSTYTFTASASDNGASYRCRASNSNGSIYSNAASLTVRTLPSITTQPVNQTANAGSSVVFNCAATGNPVPTIQWQKNSVNIIGATSGSYAFSAASADNGASYRCIATNAAGSATSNSALLTVRSAPTITTQPASQTATAGQSVTFSCAASGNPAPTYQWHKNGSAISGATSSSYTFTATGSDNGASYRCVATNIVSSATSNVATLTVRTAPTINTHPVSQTVNAGQSVTISCAASGNPVPTYQWQRNSINISGATSSSYTFTAATGDNGALYRCIAANIVTSVSSNVAVLTVNSASTVETAVRDAVSTYATSHSWNIRELYGFEFVGPVLLDSADITWLSFQSGGGTNQYNAMIRFVTPPAHYSEGPVDTNVVFHVTAPVGGPVTMNGFSYTTDNGYQFEVSINGTQETWATPCGLGDLVSYDCMNFSISHNASGKRLSAAGRHQAMYSYGTYGTGYYEQHRRVRSFNVTYNTTSRAIASSSEEVAHIDLTDTVQIANPPGSEPNVYTKHAEVREENDNPRSVYLNWIMDSNGNASRIDVFNQQGGTKIGQLAPDANLNDITAGMYY